MDALTINASASVESEAEMILTEKAATVVKTQKWSLPKMETLTISTSASEESESELILTQKAASFVKAQTWSHPTVEDESRCVEQRSSSSVDDDIRQDHESAAVSETTSSQEHMLSPVAALSPRVDESVEHTINQFIEEHRELLGDLSLLELVEQTSSDEPIVMDRISSMSSRIYNTNKQAAKESIDKQPSAEVQPPVDEPITNSCTQEPETAEKLEPKVPSSHQTSTMSGKEAVVKITTKPQTNKNVLKKLMKSLKCKMKSKKSCYKPSTVEKSVIKEDSSVALSIKPSGSITTVANSELDVARKASSSLMDKDDEDEHFDEEVPQAKEERKPLNSLANLLAVCSVKPDTSTAEFKIDHVESDGYDGGSEKTSEDEPAPKGLFSCGAELPAYGSKGSQTQQQTVSPIPSISEGSESDAPVPEMEEEEEVEKSKSKEDKLSQQVEPSKSKEIKLTKTSSTQDKSLQRVSFESKEEIKLSKTNSTQGKSRLQVEPSESEENKSTKTNSTQNKSLSSFQKTKNALLSSLRAPRIPKRMRSLPHQLDDLMKMETESSSKPDQQAALILQESSEKPLGKPPETIELENILDKTKTDSTDLLEAPSSFSADPFVCQMEAKVDLYKEKYGLIQKFGKHVKDLKKKQGKSLCMTMILNLLRKYSSQLHTNIHLRSAFHQ